jgi:uncharacterized protein (TIGR02271 family)
MEQIVTVYDSTEKAIAAARVLESSGYSSKDISLHNRDSLEGTVREKGLWRRLFGSTVRDQDSATYSRAIESGGALLSIRVPGSEAASVMKILGGPSTTDSSTTASSSIVSGVSPTLTSAREEVVRLAEEQLNIDKRQVETGKTRIRRFMTEKPIESKVSLHEEHEDIQRRAVTDPADVKDIDWAEKTLEFVETDEQAVVKKVARITEEIVVRRTGSDHVETIRDTIRRQQVEVEHLPREMKDARDIKKAA